MVDESIAPPDLEATVVADEPKQPPHKSPKRVGVLFVHGIGAQRRGDTLALAGAALHGWLNQWFSRPAIEDLEQLLWEIGGGIAVELLDTRLAQQRGDEPAHAHLIFREKEEVSERSLLLAESYWAAAFSPPSYGEFVSWALRGFPLTVVLHMLSTFRRNQRIGMTSTEAIKRRLLTLDDRTRLEEDLGLDPGVVPKEAPALRKFLLQQSGRAWNRWLISPFLLPHLLLGAIVAQAFLLAVVLVGLLPIGFSRSFAGWVQQKVAAVLGDSYLFVASPITESAAVTQVKGDLAWLAERCESVVLIAHSQGAAVAHRAIEELSWEGLTAGNLKLLITYGSGLQKLFALKELLSRDPSRQDAVTSAMAMGATVFGSAGVLSSWLWIAGTAPWWVAALGIGVGFVLLMLAYNWFDRAFRKASPPLLRSVPWMNLYASSDPVCNGPIEAKTGIAAIDRMQEELRYRLRSNSLHEQREVVNLDSVVADHTHYWTAKDDFVSRVAQTLLRIGDIPSPGPVDDEWIAHGTQRRRWRVGFRAGCRRTSVLAALCLAFWPRDVVVTFGRFVVESFAAALGSLPTWLVPDWTQSIADYPGTVGAGSMLVAVMGHYAVAVAGWKVWERHETGQFLRRAPFRPPLPELSLFAVGWLGALVAIPIAASLVSGAEALRPTLWTLLPLLAITGLTIARLGKGPNLFSTFIPALLAHGESVLELGPGSRSKDDLARAQKYFSWAKKRLRQQGDSEHLVQAQLGYARGIEQAELTNADTDNDLREAYEEAAASLKRMGKDASLVEQRLKKLSSGASEMTQQE